MKAGQLEKPLCSRYAFAEFKILVLPVNDDGAVRDVAWRWALGLYKPGAYELLGAWPSQASHEYVSCNLHERGVERIDAIADDYGIHRRSRFARAVIWPPKVASEEVGASRALHAFSRRQLAAVQSTGAVASQLQSCLARAIRRHGPFADEAAAADFLVQRLQRADQRFWSA